MSDQSEFDDTMGGFGPVQDAPMPYMQRMRDYYLALGSRNPLRWAQYGDVPFAKLSMPLSPTKVGLVNTAALYLPDQSNQGPGAPYNAAAKFYRVDTDSIEGGPDMQGSLIGIDRRHTAATDIDSHFPLKALRAADAEGRVGKFANRSQVTTVE